MDSHTNQLSIDGGMRSRHIKSEESLDYLHTILEGKYLILPQLYIFKYERDAQQYSNRCGWGVIQVISLLIVSQS